MEEATAVCEASGAAEASNFRPCSNARHRMAPRASRPTKGVCYAGREPFSDCSEALRVLNGG